MHSRTHSTKHRDVPTHVSPLPAWRRVMPVIALLILAPVIVEVLFGSTPITALDRLPAQICIYGGGALLCRTLVRYHRRGWSALLLLGIAFAIAEECVILQTSVNPFYFPGGPDHIYSWAFGVNWVYLLWALVDEGVWAILLPIQLTECMFPDQRDDIWLNAWGVGVVAVAFVLASVDRWYAFTHVGIAPGKAYAAPLPLVLVALTIIIVLGVIALGPWTTLRARQSVTRRAMRPWLVGLIASVLSILWFALVLVPYVVPASLPATLPLVMWSVIAIGTALLVRRWSSSAMWGVRHRFALVFGALVGSMLAGFIVNGVLLSPTDLVGKLVLNVLAIVLMAYLGWKIRRRTAAV